MNHQIRVPLSIPGLPAIGLCLLLATLPAGAATPQVATLSASQDNTLIETVAQHGQTIHTVNASAHATDLSSTNLFT